MSPQLNLTPAAQDMQMLQATEDFQFPGGAAHLPTPTIPINRECRWRFPEDPPEPVDEMDLLELLAKVANRVLSSYADPPDGATIGVGRGLAIKYKKDLGKWVGVIW